MSSFNITCNLSKTFHGYSLKAFKNSKQLINVSPGPSQIPPRVIQSVIDKLGGKTSQFNYGNTPLEMSHRSPEFAKILTSLNSSIRTFMKIPNDFDIFWTPGGGHGQFSAIPMNMKRVFENKPAYYVVNGTWSKRAYEESKKFITTSNVLDKHYTNKNPLCYNDMPKLDTTKLKDGGYLYLCSNETVNGIEFHENKLDYPKKEELGNCKIIVDMSSDFLMKKVDWDNVDIAFACSSKNMGTAGTNIVIARKDILDVINNNTSKNERPSVLDWKLYNNSNSLYNTPSIFNLYFTEQLIEYYSSFGNIDYFHELTKTKGKIVYEFLNKSILFKSSVKNNNIQSNINIPFIVNGGCIDTRNQFLHFCYMNNLVGLRTKLHFHMKKWV